jgi:hypothetical protein
MNFIVIVSPSLEHIAVSIGNRLVNVLERGRSISVLHPRHVTSHVSWHVAGHIVHGVVSVGT